MQRITVIIVSYNSQPYLQACLASIITQREIATDIIVVDNASTDSSVALVTAEFPTARLIANQENRGFAVAVNQGVTLATGEYVLLLNPDATLFPGALAYLIDFLETHPQVAAAGPRQWLDAERTWQCSIVPRPLHWRTILSGLPGLRRLGLARRQLTAHWALNRAIWRDERPRVTPYLSGACVLLRRKSLQAVGGLDERYFLYYEDVDLCERLRAAGWMLYAVPLAEVVHTVQGSVRTTPDSGERHLHTSARHFLSQHGDLATRTTWAVLQSWRAQRLKRDSSSLAPRSAPQHITSTLRWSPMPDATAYWVELSSDTNFIYAAATQVTRPACTLPPALLTFMQERTFVWRVAPINTQGGLGPALIRK